jgi:ATP-binding cassette subfamily B protein
MKRTTTDDQAEDIRGSSLSLGQPPDAGANSARAFAGIAGFLRAAATPLRPRWKLMTLAVVAKLPGVALETVQPMLLMVLIDALVAGNQSRVWFAALALIALIPAYVLGNFTSGYAAARTGAGVVNDLRVAMFERLQDLSLRHYASRQSGDLLSSFASDLDAVERGLAIEVPFGISCVLTVVVGGALLFAVQWPLALTLLALLPVLSLGPRLLGSRADQAGDERQQDASRVLNVVEENIAIQPLIKVFGLRQLALTGFREQLGVLFRSSVKASFLSSLQGSSMNASGSILLVVAIAGGTVLAERGHLSVGGLVAVIDLLWFMVASLEALAEVVPPLQRAGAGMRRIQRILEERPEVVDDAGAQPLPPFSRDIVFREVGFGYRRERPVLTDVTFRIAAGETVFLVGQSGAGKSTLISLLLRLHDPTAGSILIDGLDLKRVTQASLRDQIGVVLQESFLLDTSIRDNIRMGKLDATDDEIEWAARSAEIHDFVVALPEGYHTRVGERGRNLSVGQRQRVAIARALIRQPAILILDEPASALDPQTEAAINATLRRLSRGRTVLSITHRLASAAHADRILVLKDGHLVEQGTHERLLEMGNVYSRLWQGPPAFVDGGNAPVATHAT